jgi:hypothetical protein
MYSNQTNDTEFQARLQAMKRAHAAEVLELKRSMGRDIEMIDTIDSTLPPMNQRQIVLERAVKLHEKQPMAPLIDQLPFYRKDIEDITFQADSKLRVLLVSYCPTVSASAKQKIPKLERVEYRFDRFIFDFI